MREAMSKSRFERHPRKALAAILAVAAIVLVLVLESLPLFPKDRYLGPADPGKPPELIRRMIRLKEHLPGFNADVVPTDRYLLNTDSLEKRPYPISVDGNGFIEPSKVHEESDLTIAFLGGSTTECLYVDPDKRFPFLVGRRLEEALKVKVNSFNSGVSGNHTMHANLILMSKILPMRPDIVVLMEAGNDFGTMLMLDSYWNDSPTRGIIVREEVDPSTLVTPLRALKSFLYSSLPNTYTLLKRGGDRVKAAVRGADKEADLPPDEDEFARERGKQLAKNVDRYLLDFRHSLETFVAISRAWGITPVLMTQANRMGENPDPAIHREVERIEKSNQVTYREMRAATLRFEDVIRQVAAEQNVLLIDLHKGVPQTSQYMYDAMHYNNTGSLLATDLILEKLQPAVAGHLSARRMERQP